MKRHFFVLITLMILFDFKIQDVKAQNTDSLIQSLVSRMTLEEKAALCSGKDTWTTKPIDRLNIPSIWMTDGPHGLRKSVSSSGFEGEIVPATSFPSASSLAASWDTPLIEKMGRAIGKECQANQVQIILGPGINMKRSPLNGRNFEYYSEDPVLAGEMGAAFINGVQSMRVGTSLKHFAVNNQEFERMVISAEVDERPLREIYLRGFEIAVTKAHPWTVMASYNKINSVYSSENPYLLNDILRNDWGFKGIVVSDWGAVNNRVEGIRARMDLQMPGDGGLSDKKIVEAVKQGKLSETDLNLVVSDLLRIILKAKANEKQGVTYDKEQHHLLARRIGSECIVLLKNDGKILPLDNRTLKKVAVIGLFAKEPRFLGGGSSSLRPTKIDIPYDEMAKLAGNGTQLTFADGYSKNDSIDDQIINNAVKNAKDADVAVIFAGLPSNYESEGYDRKNLDLPPNHNKLIEAVAAAQKNVVVVLFNGSPVIMPWLSNVKAVVEGGLNGQATGGAIADVLFGVVNPSGKLAETYPKRLEDNPSFINFPGENKKVRYGEGLFIGYRYYDAKKIVPLFPFGYGLSYTTFSYSDLKVSAKQIKDTIPLEVSLKVKNTGNVAGKEVVQLYVSEKECSLQRPIKELKAFKKVSLDPGQEKVVTFTLGFRDFAFYNPAVKDWMVESGDFDILVGASSTDIKLKKTVDVIATKSFITKLTRNSLISEWLAHPKGKSLIIPVFQQMLKEYNKSNEASGNVMNIDWGTMFGGMPISKLIDFSQGMFTEEMLDGMIQQANQ